jgi:iron complex outermembrane receptor protein
MPGSHLRARHRAMLLICSMMPLLAAAQGAHALDISEQELAEALRAVGRQTNTNIIFDPAVAKGLRAQSLRARLTADEALERLLAGTRLAANRTSASTIVIQKQNAPAPVAPAPAKASTESTEKEDGSTRKEAQNRSFWDRFRLAQATEEPETVARDAVGTARSTASAPETVAVVPEVLVVGSRSLNMDIRRTRDDAQPYVIFDREKIEQSGATSLEGFLRDRLAMNTNGTPNALRPTQVGNQSSFNLRGLGATQTLILVDGRRLPPGPATGSSPRQADLNGIPMSAVQRIEVLPATASGIYGGSATGGVINIVLRRDYAGSEFKLAYGNTFESDVASRRIDASTGFNLEGGRTNLLITGSFTDENPLTLAERPFLVERYYDIARANAPGLLQPPNVPPLGSTTNIRSANGSNLVLDNGTPLEASYTHVPVGYAGAATDGGSALVANAGTYNLALANSSQSITGAATQIAANPRMAAVQATLHREFSQRLRAFLEISGSRNETIVQGTTSLGSSNTPYRVAANASSNPFNTDIIVTVPDGSLNTRFETELTQRRATAGLVATLPGNWHAGADYTWARTSYDQGGFSTGAGTDSAAVLSGAVDVIRDTNAYPANLSSYATVFDLYGLQHITLGDAVVRFAGPLFELPAGPVGATALLEYRTEEFSEMTTALPPMVLFVPGREASVASVYLETKIPLVSAKNALPGVRSLELQLAGRMDEYRTTGRTGFVIVGTDTPVVTARNETSSVNPTLALRWLPAEDLAVRLSYGTGFVAPDVGQLSPSLSLGESRFADPRRGGTTTVLPAGGALQGGNPNLGPEESESWSAGLVLTPRFVPGLRLSVDYTRIEKTNNIAGYPGGLQALLNDEAQFPDRIQRGPNLPGDPAGWAGPVTFLDTTLLNIASAEVEAFDFQLDYTFSTAIGTFAFNGIATRQTHYKTRALASLPEVENVGITYSSPQGFSGSGELSWQHRGWSAGWLARYYDDYFTVNPSLITSAANLTLQGNGGRVPSQMYHDVFVSWRPGFSGEGAARLLADTDWRLSVRNIFDKVPPFDANFYNIFRTYHSPLGDARGASWQLAVTKRF